MNNAPSASRPLVSYAVLAYNQEMYIGDAVESALSQTYTPLEIILSDDCSSDGTFEIINQKAAAYSGPHKVICRQNVHNLGLAEHISTVVDSSEGAFIVFAAGDDRSSERRVEQVERVFRSSDRCLAVFSQVREMGDPLSVGHGARAMSRKSIIEIFMNSGGVGRGAAYAYHRDLFTWVGRLPKGIQSEDKFLPACAALVGEVFEIHERLVDYRRHEQSLTEHLRRKNSFAHQRPEHWRELRRALRRAKDDGRISRFKFALVGAVAGVSRLHRNHPSNLLYWGLFLAARALRRASRGQQRPILE